MARSPNSRAKANRRSGGGTLIGIFIGLVIGVLIAAGVVFYLNKATLPFQEHGSARPEPATKGGETRPADNASASASGAPQSLPGKPGDKPPEKRFTFYDILPGKEEAVPGTVPANPPPAEKAPVAAVAPGESLFLQVGAFQKSADADNLKARLALLGLEAGVQEVEIPDKGPMFRVRVGPYSQVEEMNRVRGLLSQNGIAVSVVKTKESGK